MRMSYSSQKAITACERKYAFEKIFKIPADPDVEENYLAFSYGKAYHQVLEDTGRDGGNFTMDVFNKALKDHNLNSLNDEAAKYGIYACLMKYYELRAKSKLFQITTELEIGEPDVVVGYIDSVLADINGNWWLEDNKTSSSDSVSMLPRIKRDPQLGLYASYLDQICEKLGLDKEKFQGVRYCSVVKPRHLVKKGETLDSYATRSNPIVFEVVVPKEDLQPAESKALLLRARDRANALEAGEEPIPNYESCFNYFRPCAFWSQCYGKTYSESKQELRMYTAESMDDQTIPEEEIF